MGIYASEQQQIAFEEVVSLNYQDTWPTVEVTIAVNKIGNLDLADNSFEVDFWVYLDWVDTNLVKGEHYTYHAEVGSFELAKCHREHVCDDRRFFNPCIQVENIKNTGEDLLQHADEMPIVMDEVSRNGDEVPWLTKKFHFMGALSCRDADAKAFPFDLERLNIKVVALQLAGATSSGKERQIRLVEPVLRPTWRASRRRDPLPGWALALGDDDFATSHTWKVDDDGDVRSVGEMELAALGGVAMPASGAYTLHIILRRRWFPRYLLDFGIISLQVIAAAASLWVPFTPDMLANRMSITLTVLLTLVSASGARPPVIESVPYPTLYDNYGKLMVFFVASVVGIANLFGFASCWGMYRGSGKGSSKTAADYFDSDLQLTISSLADEWWCEEGPMRTSKLDFMVLVTAFVFLTVVHVSILVWSQIHRFTTLLKVKHAVDAPDESYGPYSRLVMCRHGQFELVRRGDFLGCVTHVRLFPGTRCFWRIWRCVWTLGTGVLRAVCCCGCSRSSREWRQKRLDGFHPLDSRRLLEEATRRVQDRLIATPQLTNFPITLSPLDVVRVLDVGSGEVGFYSYWLDNVTGRICAEGVHAKKLKYDQGQTFVDLFVTNSEGPAKMANEIIARFNLKPKPKRFTSFMLGAMEDYGSPHSAMATGKDNAESLLGAFASSIRQAGASASDVHMMGNAVVSGLRQAGAGGSDQLPGTIDEDLPAMPPMEPSKKATGLGETLEKMTTLLVCLTGSNRQMLRDDEEGRRQLDSFIKAVNEKIAAYALECVVYCPRDTDEAMYELCATEWIVQHGDLDVSQFRLDRAQRTLKGGRGDASVSLQEVLHEYASLRADLDLRWAYRQARKSTVDEAETGSMRSSFSQNGGFDGVTCAAFYRQFERNTILMRSLIRSRLFSGVLSAGSGSSQVTLVRADATDGSQVHSIPLGNRTPLVGMKITTGHEEVLFSSQMPQTHQKARELLCGPGPVKETRPAWSEVGAVDPKRLQLWKELVSACATEKGFPITKRGLFVGISAVFYAAQEAGCDDRLMEASAFLERLEQRRHELLLDAGKNHGRPLANLTLVVALVETVLHPSALIVCKRQWKVGGDGEDDAPADFIATWTLGLYLKHSGALAVSRDMQDDDL